MRVGMVRWFVATLLCLAGLAGIVPALALDRSDLVGSWRWELYGIAYQIEFRADGTGTATRDTTHSATAAPPMAIAWTLEADAVPVRLTIETPDDRYFHVLQDGPADRPDTLVAAQSRQGTPASFDDSFFVYRRN